MENNLEVIDKDKSNGGKVLLSFLLSCTEQLWYELFLKVFKPANDRMCK